MITIDAPFTFCERVETFIKPTPSVDFKRKDVRRGVLRRAGAAIRNRATLKLDSAPAGAAVARGRRTEVSLRYLPLLRLATGISNLAVPDKEAAMFRADFALNRERQEHFVCPVSVRHRFST